MATKLFVGGLAYTVNDNELKELFLTVGTVVSAQVIVDRSSNQSKGFGFVEMSTVAEAQKAIKELSGKELGGRAIIVNAAKPREEQPRRDFGPQNRTNNRAPRY